MSKQSNPVLCYRILVTVVVDHPECRGESLPVVPTGKVIHTIRTARDRATAVSVYEQIVAGEDDFASEYVARLSVEAVHAYPTARRAPLPRPRVERLDRSAAWTAVV